MKYEPSLGFPLQKAKVQNRPASYVSRSENLIFKGDNRPYPFKDNAFTCVMPSFR